MTGKTERPLSPHLQIYRWQLTMAMSILHRICGAALAVGIAMIVWLLVSAAAGEDAYNQFIAFCNSLIGKLMLSGWALALSYHLCNGVRHLIWDTVHLFELKNAYRAGYVVLLAAAALAAVLIARVWGLA
jgi:succinate dehydrogenase / fumarate reductase cytochrome b subunit